MGSYPPGTSYEHLHMAGIVTLCVYCQREVFGDPVYLDTGIGDSEEPYHMECAIAYLEEKDIAFQFEEAFYTAMDVLADVQTFGCANAHQRKAALQQLEQLIKNLHNLRETVMQVNTNGFKKLDTKHQHQKNKEDVQ